MSSLKSQNYLETSRMDAALCGFTSESSSVGLLVVTWTASCIVACGKDHCTGSTGIEAYYWPACQALLTKLIPWKKYNVENDMHELRRKTHARFLMWIKMCRNNTGRLADEVKGYTLKAVVWRWRFIKGKGPLKHENQTVLKKSSAFILNLWHIIFCLSKKVQFHRKLFKGSVPNIAIIRVLINPGMLMRGKAFTVRGFMKDSNNYANFTMAIIVKAYFHQ